MFCIFFSVLFLKPQPNRRVCLTRLIIIAGTCHMATCAHWLVAAVTLTRSCPWSSAALWTCTHVPTSISGPQLREAYFCDFFFFFWVNLVKGDTSATDEGHRCRGVAERCSLANCSADDWSLLAQNFQSISFYSVVRSQEISWPRLCGVWLMGSHLRFRGTQE